MVYKTKSLYWEERLTMNQSATKKTSKMVIVLNKIKTYFSKPQNIILLLFGIVLTFTTVAPIVAIVEDTFKIHPGTIDAHLTGKADIPLLTMWICSPVNWREQICGHRC